MLTKLSALAKELDECNVPQNDRYVVISEDKCIALFGEEEGKKCWKDLLARCPDEGIKILDPTKQDIPPWSV
jgi:hypothetical protein